jgi:hypothetical protein
LHLDEIPSHTFFFIREFLTITLLSLFPPLKIKLKGHHFDATEVIEAESQEMLNTFTEHNFQDAFKKCWKWCICTEGDYFEGDGGQWVQS